MAVKKTGPRAPTRLAKSEQHLAGDHLRTRVYYCPESDAFLIVDPNIEPTAASAVITRKLDDNSLIIEPYFGQHFIGVVRVLEIFWRSAHSVTGILAPLVATLML